MRYVSTKEQLLKAADAKSLILLCFFSEYDQGNVNLVSTIEKDQLQYITVCIADPKTVDLRIQYQASAPSVLFLTKTVFSRDLLVRARLRNADINAENIRSLIPEYAELSLT